MAQPLPRLIDDEVDLHGHPHARAAPMPRRWNASLLTGGRGSSEDRASNRASSEHL